MPASDSHYHDILVQRRKKRRRKVVAIVVIALVAVLALGGAAFGIFASQLDTRLALDGDQAAQIDDVLVDADLSKPFYALVLGSDSREGSGTSNNPAMMGDNERSDVMILLRVDAQNRLLTMLSIPRDTPYHLDDGSIVKINEVYNIDGAAGTIKAVSELTGVPISHFAEVRFSEFQEMVDSLGGVTVNVPIELSYKDALTGETVTLEPGVQTLDGQQAQIFVRARHEYGTDQDAHRQSAVRQMAAAIVEEVLSKPPYELPGTVLSLASCVGTDMKASDLVSLALAFAGGSGGITMYSGTGPTDGDVNEAAGGIWLCYENPQGWKTLMQAVDSGKDPSEIDVESMATGPAMP